jgi:hypothetical protein
MLPRAADEETLAPIRLQVNDSGSAIIPRKDLRVLCPDELSIGDQFLRIAQIARAEGWSFEFLSDGAVRVSSRLVSRRLSAL